MTMTLMVERHVIPGEQGSLKKLLRELRSSATRRPGFISGRTVVDAFSPTIFLTISEWANMAAWDAWKDDPGRMEIVGRINELVQGEPVQRTWVDDEDVRSAYR